MLGVSKAFGPTVALSDVSFTVDGGSVHALLGENGAGKSTLMKILSGAYRPDSGELTLAGVPFRPEGPHDARRAGVAMIYQELNLAPHLSVEDNVMLGRKQVSQAGCGVTVSGRAFAPHWQNWDTPTFRSTALWESFLSGPVSWSRSRGHSPSTRA